METSNIVKSIVHCSTFQEMQVFSVCYKGILHIYVYLLHLILYHIKKKESSNCLDWTASKFAIGVKSIMKDIKGTNVSMVKVGI
jgi:hypothetical protein